MYESPINIVQQITKSIANELDENIYKAVLKTGIEVNKDELIKALTYDRAQYDKGFNDGIDALVYALMQIPNSTVYKVEVKQIAQTLTKGGEV